MPATIPLATYQAELSSLMSSAHIAMVPTLEPDFSISLGGPVVGEPYGPVEAARSEWEPLLFSTKLDDFLDRADPVKADSLRLSSVMQSRQTLRDWTQLPFGKLLIEAADGTGTAAVCEGSPYRHAFRRIKNLSADQIVVTLQGNTLTDVSPDEVRDAALELLCSSGISWGLVGAPSWLELRNFTKVPAPLRETISKAFAQQAEGRWPSAIRAARYLFLSGLLFKHLGKENDAMLGDILLYYSAKLLHGKQGPDAAAMVIDLISGRMPDLSRQTHRGWLFVYFCKQDYLLNFEPKVTDDPRPDPANQPLMALRISQGLMHALAHEDWLAAFECGQLLRYCNAISSEPGWRHDVRSAFSLARYFDMTPDRGSDADDYRHLRKVLFRAADGIYIDEQYGHLSCQARKLALDVPNIVL